MIKKNVKALSLTAILGLSLTGCVVHEELVVHQRSRCFQNGYRYGTPEFASCAQREAQKQNINVEIYDTNPIVGGYYSSNNTVVYHDPSPVQTSTFIYDRYDDKQARKDQRRREKEDARYAQKLQRQQRRYYEEPAAAAPPVAPAAAAPRVQNYRTYTPRIEETTAAASRMRETRRHASSAAAPAAAAR